MTHIKRSQAIKLFLQQNTWPDLAELYTDEMEVQVNVAQDGGKRVDRFYQGKSSLSYTDGVQTWSPFRMPRNSMGVPEDNDFNLSFDLPLHIDGIGITGWNWKKRLSKHIAFDFDSIVGHSEKHSRKLNQDEIDEIRHRVQDIPWVTIRKSTGGAGLHLYVHLDDSFNDVINNHNEHIAVGRAVLSQLSAIAGFDLEAKVDVYAGNMWVWHRKMLLPDGTRKPDSLLLIKPGEKLKDIPKDWRTYIDVVTGKRRRTVPFFIKEGEKEKGTYDEFEEISNQRPKIPLDEDHQKLIDWIQHNSPGGSWWRDDHWMLVTHTYTLKMAHKALGLKGSYDTLAQGTEYGADHNCYLFSMPNGAWRVRRFSKGCTEHPFWAQDGHGWTSIWFNKLPDFKTACRLNGGIEKANGGFVFSEANKAIDAAKMLGGDISVPDRMLSRTAILKQHRDKRLIIELDKETKDTADGLVGYDGTGKSWTRIFDGKSEQTVPIVETMHLDKIIRHIVSEGNSDEGWVVKNGDAWRDEPLEHVKLVLKGHFGYKPADVDQILGTGVVQPYKIINRPFDVEYPPGRLWNRHGAKLRFQPSQDIDNLKFDTWLKIMEHLGRSLNIFIRTNPWAQANNIQTGADYLLLWTAAKFQRPYDRLPYLFFYSDEQNTGKSTFHEALALLLDGDPPRGYMKVNEALKATSQFNAELQHAILCVVEELDLNPRKNDAKISYNRIKELVTANNISIHEKRQTPIMVKNSTSWLHCFLGSEYTLTNKGPKQIKDLLNKSSVLIINQHKILTQGSFLTGKREVFELETVEGYVIRATADHKLLQYIENSNGARSFLSQNSPSVLRNYNCWKDLSKFLPGEQIVLNNHNEVEWDGYGTFEEGYLVGWIFGDGSFLHDFDLLGYILSIFTEEVTYSKSEKQYDIRSKELNRLIEELGLKNKKIITNQMKSASSDFYKGFISAMFDTDGTVENYTARISLGQSNLQLLQDVQQMLIFLGIKSVIRQVTQPNDAVLICGRICKAKAKYVLRISMLHAQYFAKIINFQEPHKRKKLAEQLAKKRSHRWDNQKWYATVKSIKSIGEHLVYDITVPELNRLSINGLMAHNCSNDKTACPIFRNDSRITMIRVFPIDEIEMIPKKKILDLLIKEAPDFLAYIFRVEIPESNDRLTVPVIETEDKAFVQRVNLSIIEQFIQEECFAVDGEQILWSEFFERFQHYLEPSDVEKFTKRYTGSRLPEYHPRARRRVDNQYCVANISWSARNPETPIKPRLIVCGDYLVPLQSDEESPNGQK